MKKILALMFLSASFGAASAQSVFPTNGANVGIGTITPQEKLDVRGNILISNAEIPLGLNTEVGGTVPLFNMSLNFREANKKSSFLGAAFRIDSRAAFPLFQWLKRDAGTDTEYVLMNLGANGNLGLGTFTPSEKLSVNGNIRAREIKVEATNWPDYVFAEDYKVGTLAELESYIKANKHLPEIPSAKEVQENGIALGEMNKLLLKKVEEITLYLIQKDREMIIIKKELEALKSKAQKL
ncbi:hypothetical protein OQX63_17590 [Pedobacter sp. PF22-3]|uniref:hypothetical protein n=1 Tax=Pedobacter sp. PF22-3 TaxID=2994467 RepID=UPI0022475A03|nr:hypothetical protein [Pedobacter sp. PF22-3]MCX2495308.1 hypothetical protein [Pedobacter sp. PF22-3]